MSGRTLTLLMCSAAMACAPQPQLDGKAIAEPSAPEIIRGLEIRRQYGQPIPVASSAIYVDSVAVHHTRSEGSTIVWLGADGRWQWSQVSQTGPGGLLDAEPRMDYTVTRQFTDEESRTLESLLADESLYRGEVRRTGAVGVGAPFHVMEIVTPKGQVVYRWDGRLRDKAGMIADLVLGAA